LSASKAAPKTRRAMPPGSRILSCVNLYARYNSCSLTPFIVKCWNRRRQGIAIQLKPLHRQSNISLFLMSQIQI